MSISLRSQWGLTIGIALVVLALFIAGAAPANGAPTNPGSSLAQTEDVGDATNDSESSENPPGQGQDSPVRNNSAVIRNIVFLDLDGDGIQEAGEIPLAGITVNLFDSAGNPLATRTTSAEGRYTFGEAAGVVANRNFGISFDASTNTSPLPGGFFNRDLQASDISVRAGGNDDAGLTLPFDLALRTTVDTSTINLAARTVSFNLTVINQGRTVSNFQIVDYLDYPSSGQWASFVPGLNPSGSAGGRSWSWNASNPQRPIVTVNGELAQGQQVSIPVVLRWSNPLPNGIDSLENWAEIINFNDTDPRTGDAVSGALSDHDSTPDRNPRNDDQPGGPGAPKDDSIANLNGDEDDHDVAGFGIFDLALTVQLDDGTNNRSVLPDTRVTFDITVTNQGLVDAGGITLTDYLPATGLTLADPAWTPSAGGATRVLPGRLAPGESTTVSISFTVDDGSTGQINNFVEISAATPRNASGQVIRQAGTNRAIRDVDSTFDNVRGNDNQPSGPGAATDDAVLGEGGDEDDHDVAGIRIGFFDLSVRTTLAGGFERGSVPIGNAVQFNIVVTNEGTVDATDIELIDYLPRRGLVLNDPDWTNNGDGTATLNRPVPGPIAPGGRTAVPITFLVEASATGSIYNWAEIAGADTDSDPTTRTPIDVDSTPGNNPRYDADENAAPPVPVPPTPAPEATDPAPEAADEEAVDDVESGTTADVASDEPVEAPAPIISNVRPASEDDHDFAGVSIDPPELDLALQLRIDEDVDVESLGVEDPVPFIVTVLNEGTVFADDITIVDYLPEIGLTLFDSSWVESGDGTATFSLSEPLAPESTVEIEAFFVVSPGAVGTITNSVEIASATAVDFFGTPILNDNGRPLADIDSVPFGDLQGVLPGLEDDHSSAAIHFAPPPVYDLAIFSDLAEGSERSMFAPGDVVTYDVSVLNQSEVRSADIEVVAEVPVGFTIVGRDWEMDDESRTATLIIEGPLVPGQAVTFETGFRAETDASGNFDNVVRITSSVALDEAGENLGLLDVDPSDDSITVDLSVIPTLAFSGVDVDGGMLLGWSLLAAATFVALIGVAFRRRRPPTGVRVGVVGPATSRFGPAA